LNAKGTLQELKNTANIPQDHHENPVWKWSGPFENIPPP
jgi:hypothetical protein